MPWRPNAEMALIAWLKSLPTIPTGKVATTLPSDAATWKTTGFVVVTSVGGSPDPDVALRNPVLSIGAWAVNPGSEKTPWNQAFALAEAAFQGFYEAGAFPFQATFTPLDYSPAKIMAGYPLTEPLKMPGSESQYAHVAFDATIGWVA